jgi:hypothetical protein
VGGRHSPACGSLICHEQIRTKGERIVQPLGIVG